MANPQRENGHIDIANEIVEQLARVNLSAYEWRVLMVVLRKTWGWQKKVDWIPLSQIAEMTGIQRPNVTRAKGSLLNKKLLIEHNGKIGFNKDYERWEIKGYAGINSDTTSSTKVVSNQIIGGIESDNKVVSNQIPSIEIKETIQKTKKKKGPLLQIFTHWNSYKGRSIRKRNKENREKAVAWKSHTLRPDGSLSPDVKQAITETLKAGHSVQEVCRAIDNYAMVLLGRDYWWTYVWPLTTFLMVKYERRKDAEHKWWQFLSGNFVEDNYLTEAAKRKRADNAKGPRPYELAKLQTAKERIISDEQKQTA